jgi:hypothetical protein
MINELKLQISKFIETCDNELLINEARELLNCKGWWSNALKSADDSFHLIRTEKIFVDYREQKMKLSL